MGSSVGKILSTSELESMSKNLTTMSEGVNNYIKKTQQVINSFNDQSIVQSFYSSGKFGTKEKERLTKIANALQKYWEVVANGEDSMISQTQKYISRAMENNESTPTSGVETAEASQLFSESMISNTKPGTPNPNSKFESYISSNEGDYVKQEISNPDGNLESFAQVASKEMNVYPGTPNPNSNLESFAQVASQEMNVYPGTPGPNSSLNNVEVTVGEQGMGVADNGGVQ